MGKIKKFIKDKIYNTRLLHLGNKILMESSPDFSDNAKFIYDELIKEGINNSYKIYWIVKDKKEFSDIKVKNVKFVNRNSLYYKYLIFTSKVIIDSNMFIPKRNKYQLRIYLEHGMLLKEARKYFDDIGEYDFFTVTSDYFKDIYARDINIDPNKIICLGYPRDDYLKKDYDVFFPEIKRKKTIIWMPTYRNHKLSTSLHTGINFEYGIPCISNEEELKTLNKKLADNNILLLIKLHPAEDTSKISNVDLSHIKIVDNNVVSKKHKNIYDYLLGIDALITDYSSIFYDFLITERKIGLAIPDIDEFFTYETLAFPKYEDYIKGFYIKKFSDLLDYIDYVNSGSDPLKKERLATIPIFMKYNDCNSSKRFVEFLLKQLGGKKHEK